MTGAASDATVADSDAELVEAIRFLGQNSEPSRPFDDTHPDDPGSRRAIPLARHGLRLVLPTEHRDPSAHLTDVSLADLADGGLMPYEVAQFLDAAILARKSMVISGDQGAGKPRCCVP